jgi:hypothetical protein
MDPDPDQEGQNTWIWWIRIRNTGNKKLNYLDPAARPLRPGGGRPEGKDGVVDEGVVLPGQRQLHLHDVLLDVDRIHCVSLAQP